MASEVLLPKQGNTVESCIIIEWKKSVGDTVKTGDAIVEVETDKATLDVEATADGVLLSRLAEEGDDVPVLTPIAIIGEPGETVPDKSATKSPAPDADLEKSADVTSSQAERAAPVRKDDGGDHAEPPTAAAPGKRQPISPRARRLAESHGVDYAGTIGSGPGGRLMVKDIEALIASGKAGPPAAGTAAAGPEQQPVTAPQRMTTTSPGPRPEAEYEETRITGIRKVIAERMHASLANSAQLTMHSSADARQLLAYRARLKASQDEELRHISINDLVLFAVSRTLPAFRSLNATFEDGVIRTYSAVNLGFAVDTERGLMVPTIRDADQRSLASISAESHRLAEKCMSGKAGPDDLTGATFTITNLGSLGIQSFTPVLNPPQVGILGACSIEPKPVATEGETQFIPHIGLSLTIDHQVVDGAPAARFLAALARTIAHIDTALAR